MVSSIRRSEVMKWALRLAALSAAFTFICAAPPCAQAMDELLLDDATLTHLEQQAANAQFKEQCILYTELLHDLTEIAGKQLADGQDEQAATTFRHIDSVSEKVRLALAKDAKRLKNAELIMEHTTRRLSDMLHITSGDQHATLLATLTRVNTLHSLLLTQVFAK